MNDLTFQILKVAIAICASLITLYAVPYLHELQKDVRYSQLFQLISVAVRAAEQTIKEKGMGPLKKERVKALIDEYVEDNKLNISDCAISDMIEACVYELKQEAK